MSRRNWCMHLTSRKNRSTIVVVLFHDFTFDDAIFPASYVIEKRADFLGRQQHVAFLGGIDHTAIADDIVRCGYLYRRRQ
jgi:hypothetical protein